MSDDGRVTFDEANQEFVTCPNDRPWTTLWLCVSVFSICLAGAVLVQGIARQFTTACAASGELASAPNSGTGCAQTKPVTIMVIVAAAAFLVALSRSKRQPTLLTAAGISRPGVLGRRFTPWSSVRSIDVGPAATPYTGVRLGGLILGAALNAAEAAHTESLWQVTATVRDSSGEVSIGLIRGEALARAWASALTDWLGDRGAAPGEDDPGVTGTR